MICVSVEFCELLGSHLLSAGDPPLAREWISNTRSDRSNLQPGMLPLLLCLLSDAYLIRGNSYPLL